MVECTLVDSVGDFQDCEIRERQKAAEASSVQTMK